MKIGIVTFEFNYNYGALLQAYALVSHLKGLGHDVQILNRGWGQLPKAPQPKTLRKRISTLIGEIYTLKSINDFRRKYLPLTEPIHSEEDLDRVSRKFDLIIVGSDQIWSEGTTRQMGCYYFTDFAIRARVPVASYAASMGKDSFDVPPGLRTQIAVLLSGYTAVSCRERQTIGVLKRLGAGCIQQVLDPTLIVNKQCFDKLTIGGDLKDFISYYILDPSEKKKAILERVRQTMNLPTRNTYLKEYNIPIVKNKYPSVESWLSNIGQARMVVTDSFHGMVFSIIFKRNFVVIANEKRGVARFTSLLEQIGLEDRIVKSAEEVKALCKAAIDYNEVDRKLSSLVEKSRKFITDKILN